MGGWCSKFLMRLVGLLCGKILGEGGGNCLDLLHMEGVMVLRSDFGMICGVGIRL
jgi:hypothetical protein